MKGFNNDIRRRAACAKPLAVYCLGLCLLGHVSLANSADLGPTFNWLTNQVTSPGTSSWGYGGAGSRAVSVITPTIATDGTNRAVVSMAGRAVNPAGVGYTVNVAGRIAPAAGAKFLTRAIPIVGTLATGYAIYDLIKEMGYEANKDGNGVAISKPDPASCALGASCEQYLYGAGGHNGAWGGREYACKTGVAAAAAAYPSDIQSFYGTSYFGNPGCFFTRPSGSVDVLSMVGYRTITGTGTTYQPATMQELEDAIAAKSGWPTSSNYSKALRDAQDALNEPLPVDSTSITTSGPSTTQGGTRTVQNSDGTKAVTTTTYNNTYNGPNVTTTTTNVTNNYNASSQITNTTTETVTPEPTKETQTDCDKYPDSNACRQDEFDTPDTEVPKKTITVTWAAENLGFGGGKCIDAQSIHTALGTTTLNFTSYCAMIETWVKPLVIAFSLLAAFFIVAPVRTET